MPKQRTPVVIANWKMYKTHLEAAFFIDTFNQKTQYPTVTTIICPPFTSLETLSKKTDKYHLGAQNMASHLEGAFTGEVSVNMLQSLNVQYIILGHSERRQLFSETNQCIQKKVQIAINHNLTPIICIGETLEERNNNQTLNIIQSQLEKALHNISLVTGQEIIIAYEPIWAIGTGLAATPEIAQTIHYSIRSFLSQQFTQNIAQNIKIIYGGSLKADNALKLFEQPDIDGGLIGGASLDVDHFSNILLHAANAYSYSS